MVRQLLFRSVAVLVVGGCTTGPLNGTPVAGSQTGASFTFEGYSDQESQQISLQVLKSPTLDRTVDANWQQFGTATTSTNPITLTADPDNPLYSWETNAVVTNSTAVWPTGGVVVTRAISYDTSNGNPNQLVTFDAPTFNQCFGAAYAAGDTWSTIGQDCEGLGNQMVSLVSTAASPLTLPASEQPDWLGYKGDNADVADYYTSWNAPKTLASFVSTYGFASGDPTAVYYNNNDLGIGREMHCHKISSSSIACYVSNYSATSEVGSFGDNPTTVIANTITGAKSGAAHTGAFATVAMVYTGSGVNGIHFAVYGADQNLSTTAKLDTAGKHTTIPNNCLECHGIEGQFISGQVNNAARFLPFDPQQYLYSTSDPYTLDDQQEQFRQLNVLISDTDLTPAETDFLNGIYDGDLNTSGTWANDTYVPSGWVSSSGEADQATYLGIIKPGCRMCHMSATNAAYDFLQATDWTPSLVTTIRQYLCKPVAGGGIHQMPQAERTTQQFWATGGRGLLMTGWPTSPDDGYEACVP